jgi:hypothetical protein
MLGVGEHVLQVAEGEAIVSLGPSLDTSSLVFRSLLMLLPPPLFSRTMSKTSRKALRNFRSMLLTLWRVMLRMAPAELIPPLAISTEAGV